MALTNRLSILDKAIIVSTGNSMIVCGDATAIDVNTSDMVTAAGGTTRDWTQAGSKAYLNILINSKVLYAELIWYTTVMSNAAGAVDVRSIQDNPITFVTPLGSNTITPTNTESFTSASGSIHRFRSTVVTSIVSSSLSGAYTISNIPTSIPPTGLSDTRAGWALVVVYRNNAFPPKKITLTSGIGAVNQLSPIQLSCTGFTTESDDYNLKGQVFLACANGKPLIDSESLKAGSSFATLSQIGNPVGLGNANPGTAPNNPYNNIFGGQINICDPLNSNNGLLDISGTNGNINHDAFLPTQTLLARNKWDITNININSTIIQNQTQLAMQYTINDGNGGVEFIATGSQVNALAPNLVSTLDSFDPDGDSEWNIEVGEPITYVVQINNNGEAPANNVILSTTLDPCCTFVPNSVKINGVIQYGANITTGVNAGTIAAKGILNVQFTARVTGLPVTPNPAGKMLETVSYSYQFTSGAGSPTYTNYDSTNTLEIIVQDGKLNVVKSASKVTTVVGDTVEYTIHMTNVGSETVADLYFQDVVNSYCSFVANSVKIDGVTKLGYNPTTGFELSDLLVGESTEVKFSVTVNELPPSTLISNAAEICFSFLFNQYPTPIRRTSISNTTEIQVEFVDVIGRRTNNNNYPNVGDTVTYTLTLTNVGNVTATNVEVGEPPIAGASFVNGSVYLDGVNKPLLNPFTGFTIPTIAPQQTVTINYNMLINQIQPGEVIENIAQVPFKYQISPSDPVISTEKDSNKVVTRSNFVIITMPETVDKAYATIDDILYYSVNLTNSGNIDAINTIFTSYVEPGTTFVPNSVAINGMIQPGYNPNVGFTIGTLSPNNTVNVTFQSKVTSVPNPNVVYNTSELIYSYLPDPNGNPITNTASSNTVQTIINKVDYSVVKTVDKAYAQIGDNLVYTTTIHNTGTITLNNVSFIDNLPTFVTFYPGTVYIDGVNYPDYNPNNGFVLNDIHPTESYTIVFGVTVVSTPPAGDILNVSHVSFTYQLDPTAPVICVTKYSNQATTTVYTGTMTVTKTASMSYATLNDIITYSFKVSNTGNVTLNNAFFADIVPTGAQFVTGSVSVNGISKPGYNPNDGFNIGTLYVGQVVSVRFNVKVISVPTPNVIINSASVSFDYLADPNMQPVTKTVTSNTATTVINVGSVTLTKAVDKHYATVGDKLTYTVTAVNTGTTTLTNIVFTDTIPTGATFDTGSVKIDGVSYPAYNPNDGFALNNIIAEGSSVVEFTATVTSVPNPNTIINSASITYKYRINPTGSDISGSYTSNTVTTTVNKMTVTNTKTVDKMYATVNTITPEKLTYTSVITNSGNISITDTNFVDVVPGHTTFVAGSVKIDGVTQPTFNPNLGFTLGTIAAAQSVTVEFQVTVDSLPSNGYVTNASTIYYDYKTNPNDPPASTSKTSNTVTTYINVGSITITKTPNRTYVRLTDVINYSFVITNTGNVVIHNMAFQDTIQAESTFNTNSVYINGLNQPGLDPNAGFTLGDIAVGSFITVSFDVTANSIPQNPAHALYNTGNVTYTYYVDPNGSPVVKNTVSNMTTVYVNDTIVTATKFVDKTIAKIGDVLTFSFTLHNAGSVAAENVNFEDILDSNILFNTGSVVINSVSKPTYNPNSGFPIPNIAANSTTTISFTATVMTRPADNIVYNYATINYQYKVNPNDPYIDVTMTTNTTQTYIAYGELTLTKSVNLNYATVGDTLNYTVKVQNTGSVDTTDLNFQDILQAEASFVTGTVTIDGVSYPSYNPNTGFALTSLSKTQYHIVTFSVHVDSLPASGKVENTATTSFKYQLTPTDPIVQKTATSNKVTTYIRLGYISATKAVDKYYATIGDVLNYTVTMHNSGNTTCFDMLFLDSIQAEATFVTGSVVINGVSKPLYNPNTGFALDDIIAGGTTIVTFQATVNAVPSDKILYNSAAVHYSYYIDPSNPPIITSTTSNTVATQINVGKLTVTKAVNKAYATIDDILIYTVTVSNIGNVNATAVNFRDVIPVGATFVPDSVTIDGVSQPGYDPYDSFSLGTILPGAVVVVKFNAKVTSVPTPSLISNTAQVIFTYRINPAGPDIIYQVDSNPATTQINLGQLTLTKQVDKGYATHGDVLTYTVVVTNTGNVNSTNVIFTDSLQSDITFNTGSVVVNGTSQPTYNPTVGFPLGTIPTLGHSTVSFTVTVVPVPTHDAVLNYAVGTFSYKIDPTGQDYSKSTQSNTVSTIIKVPSMTATKAVDLLYATIGDTLNYTVIVKNTGNTTNYNLNFVDYLSNGATVVSGSVMINGISYPSYDPITGFPLPDLLAGDIVNIKFAATVTLLPNPSQVTNYAVATGNYKINPLGPDYQITATSNTVTTQINVGSITNVKTVDKFYAKVLDTVTYTSVITNVGNVNALNIMFYDALQTEMSFVSGTVLINGVLNPALNPTTGFPLSDLAPNQSVTVVFTAKINTLPTPPIVQNKSEAVFSYYINPNGSIITKTVFSNTVTTNVVLGQLTTTKTVDRTIATIGNILIFTVNIINTGNVISYNAVFHDTPSVGATFNTGSVTVNGVSHTAFDPTVGFSLGDIGIGNSVTVVFTATVTSMPPTSNVTNQAYVVFDFVVDPKDPMTSTTSYSNTTTTNIALGSLNVTKAVDKQFATIGEYLTYTVTVVNNGNIDATNVIFLDPTPHNAMFVIGTVSVNSVSQPTYNPAAGFALNTMHPGEIVTVVYQVQVIS